jgi:undecaprenyl-diphosphatase
LLYWADQRILQCPKKLQKKEVSTKEALVYGLFQALALVPGTSRSGICMTAGRLMGFSRQESSRYAMLMSIPVILILGFYGMYEYCVLEHKPMGEIWNLGVGAGLSFLTALFSLHVLMTFVERVGFLPFVIYRVLLGVGLLIFVYL